MRAGRRYASVDLPSALPRTGFALTTLLSLASFAVISRSPDEPWESGVAVALIRQDLDDGPAKLVWKSHQSRIAPGGPITTESCLSPPPPAGRRSHSTHFWGAGVFGDPIPPGSCQLGAMRGGTAARWVLPEKVKQPVFSCRGAQQVSGVRLDATRPPEGEYPGFYSATRNVSGAACPTGLKVPVRQVFRCSPLL